MNENDSPERQQFQEAVEKELKYFQMALGGVGSLELTKNQVVLIEEFCSDWTKAESVLRWYNKLHPDSSRPLAEIGQAVHYVSKTVAERGSYNKRRFLKPKGRTFFDDMQDRLGREVWEGLYSFYGKVFGTNPAPVATEFELGLLACSAYAAAEPLKEGDRQLSIQVVMLGVTAVGYSIAERLPKPQVVQGTLEGLTIEIYINPGPEISWNRLSQGDDLMVVMLEDCILTELFGHLKLGDSPNPSAVRSFESLLGRAPVVQWSPSLETIRLKDA
jgi:hypothetical protein